MILSTNDLHLFEGISSIPSPSLESCLVSRDELFAAARSGNYEMVDYLLKMGVHPDITDNVGHTAGHQAARNGHVAVLNTLHASGANLNIATTKGVTVAHQAAFCGHTDFLRRLVELGWSVVVVDSNDCTPLEIAMNLNHMETVKFLENVYSKIQIDEVLPELVLPLMENPIEEPIVEAKKPPKPTKAKLQPAKKKSKKKSTTTHKPAATTKKTKKPRSASTAAKTEEIIEAQSNSLNSVEWEYPSLMPTDHENIWLTSNRSSSANPLAIESDMQGDPADMEFHIDVVKPHSPAEVFQLLTPPDRPFLPETEKMLSSDRIKKNFYKNKELSWGSEADSDSWGYSGRFLELNSSSEQDVVDEGNYVAAHSMDYPQDAVTIDGFFA